MFSDIKAIAVGAASAFAGATLMFAYASIFIVPAERREANQIAKSDMIQKFKEASNEIASDAEKFRARRLACRAAGGVFDFSTGDCRQG